MPIRAVLKVLYQLKRIKMVKDATFLLVLFFSFAMNLMILREVQTSYEQDAVLIDLFVDEEFETANYKKTFDDIRGLFCSLEIFPP